MTPGLSGPGLAPVGYRNAGGAFDTLGGGAWVDFAVEAGGGRGGGDEAFEALIVIVGADSWGDDDHIDVF